MAALAQSGAIRFEYRHFAFLGPESFWAAEASECAADQGMFWAYVDKVYRNQRGENKGAFAKENLKRFAKELGLKTGEFNACLDDGKYRETIKAQAEQGQKDKVKGTPTYLVNGKPVVWQRLDAVVPAIKEAIGK